MEKKVKIDENDLAKKAMDYFKKGNNEKGEQLTAEFLNEVKSSGKDHCTCSTKNCIYHGNCVDCVIIHRGHCEHLPECFKNMVNQRINSISCLTEHSFKKYKEK